MALPLSANDGPAPLRLCRFRHGSDAVRVGLVTDAGQVQDLTPAGITHLFPVLEADDPIAQLLRMPLRDLPRLGPEQVRFCAPVERQEVWAAGVTYKRSRRPRGGGIGPGGVGSTTWSTPRRGRSCSSRRSPTRWSAPATPSASAATRRGACRSRSWRSSSRRGRDRRLHDRQRHELARHRGREPAVPAAGEDLRPLVRARSVRSRSAAHEAAGASLDDPPRRSGGAATWCSTARPTLADRMTRRFEDLVAWLVRRQTASRTAPCC